MGDPSEAARHLSILKKGVSTWNKWRELTPDEEIHLRGAMLDKADLTRVNLSGADLDGASLNDAKLNMADLRGASLTGAKLAGADLRSADLRDARFEKANLTGARLVAAGAQEAQFPFAHLSQADLRHANLEDALLTGACLNMAQLSDAVLVRADLSSAAMLGADLSRAKLAGVDLSRADLRNAILSGAILDHAVLSECRLWESQRINWSIRGVSCQRVYWDERGEQPTEYGSGEFERRHSSGKTIELFYSGGLTSFEWSTLPFLMNYLQGLHAGCALDLRSVEDVSGGAAVVIAASGGAGVEIEELREDLLRLQDAQLKLRPESGRDQRRRIESLIFRNNVVRELLAAASDREVAAEAGEHRKDAAPADETDAAASLVGQIWQRRSEFGLPPKGLQNLESTLGVLQEELRSEHPDQAVVEEGLNIVRDLLESEGNLDDEARWTRILRSKSA